MPVVAPPKPVTIRISEEEVDAEMVSAPPTLPILLMPLDLIAIDAPLQPMHLPTSRRHLQIPQKFAWTDQS